MTQASVTIYPAYYWTCPKCRTPHFGRTAGRVDPETLRAAGVDEQEAGAVFIVPDTVYCGCCRLAISTGEVT